MFKLSNAPALVLAVAVAALGLSACSGAPAPTTMAPASASPQETVRHPNATSVPMAKSTRTKVFDSVVIERPAYVTVGIRTNQSFRGTIVATMDVKMAKFDSREPERRKAKIVYPGVTVALRYDMYTAGTIDVTVTVTGTGLDNVDIVVERLRDGRDGPKVVFTT